MSHCCEAASSGKSKPSTLNVRDILPLRFVPASPSAIVSNGGEESQCGWRKDKWGLNWQITPTALTQTITGPDAAVAKRAFDAMMTMKKIDVCEIEAAVRG